MEQTTVMKLDKNSTKPIFELESPDLTSFTCMLDTGADTPVVW